MEKKKNLPKREEKVIKTYHNMYISFYIYIFFFFPMNLNCLYIVTETWNLLRQAIFMDDILRAELSFNFAM